MQRSRNGLLYEHKSLKNKYFVNSISNFFENVMAHNNN